MCDHQEPKTIPTYYNQAIREVASLGGDADTNCCIVGGLVGAFVGVENIEKYMLKTFFEFDCTNDKMLIYEGTRRPDFLNIGRYSVNVIEKLLEIRV